MANLYLISPPNYDVYKNINQKGFGVLQPPLGLAYIAGYCKAKGHNVKIFDASFSTDIKMDITHAINTFKPDLIGITATTPQITGALFMAGIAKELNRAIRIILGGVHASALPRECLKDPNIDIVAIGEGEITVSEILSGVPLEKVAGISYRSGDGIITTGSRPLIEDLDSIPSPLWEELPVRSYYMFPEQAISVISGRGCPYRCAYCASGVVNKYRYRVRSPVNFIDELELLTKRFGLRYFFFADETFTIDYKRVEEVCSLIRKRGLKIRWTCDTRVSGLSEDIMKTLKDAGCDTIRIGIESGSNKIREAANKDVDTEKAVKLSHFASKIGIRTVAFYMLGIPYETPGTIRKTIDYAIRLDTDIAQFSMLVPLPGTPIWDLTDSGKVLRRLTDDFSKYTRYDKAVIESDSLSADQLTALHSYAIRRYYLRPRYIIKRMLSLRSLFELVIMVRAGLAVVNLWIRRK